MDGLIKLNRKEYKQKIEENLKRVEEGKPLNMPLRILNGDFKMKYNKQGVTYEERKKYIKKYMREYYKKNKVEILMKRKKKRFD